MHDDVPSHTARTTRNVFEEQNIRVLNWPVQSPDVNSIENAWIMHERRVVQGQNHFQKRDQVF